MVLRQLPRRPQATGTRRRPERPRANEWIDSCVSRLPFAGQHGRGEGRRRPLSGTGPPQKVVQRRRHPLSRPEDERKWCGMSFGQRLRGLRRDLDLSQAELADRSGCSVNTVRKLESDERRPSRELATRLSVVFELGDREVTDFLRLARGTASFGRASLPSPMTRLIGREIDVASLRQRLVNSDVRLLTLVGPPGAGKTRLALQVA